MIRTVAVQGITVVHYTVRVVPCQDSVVRCARRAIHFTKATQGE
jgi:hypothetical protein